MTANAFRKGIQAALDAGMDARIAGPPDVEEKMAALTEILSHRGEECTGNG